MPQLVSFLVFDGIPPAEEGAEPTVIWSSSFGGQNSTRNDVMSAGIFIGMIRMTAIVTKGDVCDYILTDKHEISILELDSQIYIAVTLTSSGGASRHLMNSLLSSCKDIFHLFWGKAKRNSKGKVSNSSIIQSAFPLILQSIKWDQLFFMHLWTSTFRFILSDEQTSLIASFLHDQIHEGGRIKHLALLMRKKFIVTTFPDSVSKTIQFCLFSKFPYLFPYELRSPHQAESNIENEPIVWVIGLNRNSSNNLQFFVPLIYFEEEPLSLLMLRFGKLKIIYAVKQSSIDSSKDLQVLTKALKPKLIPIHKAFCSTPSSIGTSESYLRISSRGIRHDSVLEYEQRNIRSMSQQLVETFILRADFQVSTTGIYAQIAFPGSNGFFIWFSRGQYLDSVVVINESKGTIGSLIGRCRLLAP